MIQHSFYHIRASKKEAYLSLEWTFTATQAGEIPIQLPIWRPGRYQAQHFAKNIPTVFQKKEGEYLPLPKDSSSRWTVSAQQSERIHLVWEYFAQQEDAGGSVAQPDFLYLNFINCCLYVPGCEDLPVEVQLSFPESWQTLTALKWKMGQTYAAQSFRQ